MLDWRKAVDDIGVGVSSVHIVSVDNECKELMVEVRKLKGEKVRIVCVNLHDDTREVFEFFTPSPFHPLTPSPSHLFTFSPLHLFTFLYSPNASIMKAGCFDLISERFGVSQLDKNSHLFASDTEVTDFPGRSFVIDKIITMNKRELKEALTGISRANIAVRNFPMSVAELRKRLRLQEGGDVFIFATTVANQGHRLFVCRKIS